MTDLLTPAESAETRPCKKCNGSGKAFHFDFQKERGQPPDPCYSCKGAGSFSTPDYRAILAAIKGKRGLCSKRPKDRRSYFVWRWARFNGGADVTLPMTAMYDNEGDPFEPELDALAAIVAKRVFGTMAAGAHRWGHAMGWTDQILAGLPDSAYPGGRVADPDKPIDEAGELR